MNPPSLDLTGPITDALLGGAQHRRRYHRAPAWKLVPVGDTLTPYNAPMLDTPAAACQFWSDHVVRHPAYQASTEQFVVLMLNTRRRCLGFIYVATGTLDTILVHPREVFRPAIMANAGAIIVAHNHPSGDPTPSEGDIKVTRDLIRAGQLLRIEVLDHIVVGYPTQDRPKAYSSLRELGYFYQV